MGYMHLPTLQYYILVDEKCIEVAHSVDVFSDTKSVPTVRILKTTRNRFNPMGKNRLVWYPSFISSLKNVYYYFELFGCISLTSHLSIKIF